MRRMDRTNMHVALGPTPVSFDSTHQWATTPWVRPRMESGEAASFRSDVFSITFPTPFPHASPYFAHVHPGVFCPPLVLCSSSLPPRSCRSTLFTPFPHFVTIPALIFGAFFLAVASIEGCGGSLLGCIPPPSLFPSACMPFALEC
jgi:hypothetical protein